MTKQTIQIKRALFITAYSVSSIYQAIGLIGLSFILGFTSLTATPLNLIISLMVVALSLGFAPLPDVIGIFANRDYQDRQKYLGMSLGYGLSIILTILSTYVLIALKSGNNPTQWDGLSWAGFATLFIAFVVLVVVEIAFCGVALDSYLGNQEDSDLSKVRSVREKWQDIGQEFGIGNEQVTLLLSELSNNNDVTLSAIHELTTGLQRLSHAVSELQRKVATTKTQPTPKQLLLADNMSKRQRLTSLAILQPLLAGNVVNKTKLAELFGISTTTLNNDLKEIIKEA